MQHRHRLHAIVIALLCVATVGAARPSPAADITHRDRLVGRVIHHTALMFEDVGDPVDEAILDYKRACGDPTGNTYCYDTTVTDRGSGDRIRWTLKVAYLPAGWTPDPDVEAKWARRYVRDDPDTGGGIFYEIKPEHRLKTTRVSIKLRRGGVMLTLQDIRPGGMDAEAAIAAALPRWRYFFEDAVRHRILLDEAKVRILARTTPWYEQRELGPDDLVSVIHDLDEEALIPLTVWAEADDIDPDAPFYTVSVASLDGETTSNLELRYDDGTAIADEDGDGTPDIRIPPDASTDVVARFRPYRLERGKPLGQRAALRFAYGDRAYKEEVLHRTVWYPVVRSFYVSSSEVSAMYVAPPEQPNLSEFERAVLAGHEHWWFNRARIHHGNLLTSWLNDKEDRPGIFRLARTRSGAFPANERVVMGWKLDETLGNLFVTAEQWKDDPPYLAALPTSRLEFNIDVWIEQDSPDREPYDGSAPQTGEDGVDDWGEVEGARDPRDLPEWVKEERRKAERQRELDEQRARRRNLQVEELELAVRRIDDEGVLLILPLPSGQNVSSEDVARYKMQLQQLPERWAELGRRIRMPADKPVEYGVPKIPLIDLGSWTDLDAYFPLPDQDDFGGGRRSLALPNYKFRSPGLYEVRLRLVLHDEWYRDSDVDDPEEHRREVDVAIRFNVVDATRFEVEQIHEETERRNPRRELPPRGSDQP